MKISNKQAVMLVAVLKDTLRVSNGNFGGYTQSQLCDLYDTIINQQDDVPNELGK